MATKRKKRVTVKVRRGAREVAVGRHAIAGPERMRLLAGMSLGAAAGAALGFVFAENPQKIIETFTNVATLYKDGTMSFDGIKVDARGPVPLTWIEARQPALWFTASDGDDEMTRHAFGADAVALRHGSSACGRALLTSNDRPGIGADKVCDACKIALEWVGYTPVDAALSVPPVPAPPPAPEPATPPPGAKTTGKRRRKKAASG